MTRGLQCKNCVHFSPIYPPQEIIYPYNGAYEDMFICDGKCHCLDKWHYTNSEEYCTYPIFIEEENSIEDEELIYEFLRCEAEGRSTDEIFTSRNVSGRTLDGGNG